MAEKTLQEKLKIMLPHWIAHNQSHQAEFAEWAATARTGGAEEIGALLEEAVAHMVRTDQLLEQALERLGGSAPGEHHHHH